MKKTMFILSLIFFNSIIFAQEEVKVKDGRIVILKSDGTWSYKALSSSNSSFTDARDGKTYKTTTIGEQTWMAENLSYKTSTGIWVYGDDQKNVPTYGYLYNWEVAKTACPSGWHLPSDADWALLTAYLGGENIAGGKLKETGTNHWNAQNVGATNEIGFSALPAGFRKTDGGFFDMGSYANWWSSSEAFNTPNVWYRALYHNSSNIYSNHYPKTYAMSIRCIKDK